MRSQDHSAEPSYTLGVEKKRGGGGRESGPGLSKADSAWMGRFDPVMGGWVW